MNCCTTAAQKLRILGRSARGFRRPVMTYGCFQNREDDSPQRGFRIDFAARKDDLRRLGASSSLRGEHSEPPPGGGCGSRGSEEPQCAAGNNKSRLLAGRRRCNARGVGFTGEYRFVRPVRRGSPPSTPPRPGEAAARAILQDRIFPKDLRNYFSAAKSTQNAPT